MLASFPSVLAKSGLLRRISGNHFQEGQLFCGTTSEQLRIMSGQSSTDELTVKHDPKNSKFCIKLGEAEAKLEYVTEVSDGVTVLDMWHTEVPPQLQGKGIAKVLAKEAFEYVVENKLKMRLSCSYLQKYFNDNPLDKYKSAVS